MSGGFSIFSFLGTLFATLIGVFIGFRLDRFSESRSSKNTTIQHLETIDEELEQNKEILSQNWNIINYLQHEGNDGEHYALSICSTSAWEAAQDDNIIEHIDPELYREIQSLYSSYENLNELVKRLRTEVLHPDVVGDKETGEPDIFPETWTIEVARWNSELEEVELTGLGDLIKDTSNGLKVETQGLQSQVDREKEKLSESLL